MPVYIINPGQHLVRANSRSQALRFVAEKTLKAEVAKGETVAELMAKGVKCEDARAPETADLPLEPATPALVFNGDANAGVPPEEVKIQAGGARSLDRVLDDESQVDTVSIEGIDHVF